MKKVSYKRSPLTVKSENSRLLARRLGGSFIVRMSMRFLADYSPTTNRPASLCSGIRQNCGLLELDGSRKSWRLPLRVIFRAAILSIAFLFVLLAGGYLLHGQAKTETPKTVYEDCEKLQAAIEDVDEQIKDVEYQMERARKAVANYQYVKAQNATIIEELRQWAESE